MVGGRGEQLAELRPNHCGDREKKGACFPTEPNLGIRPDDSAAARGRSSGLILTGKSLDKEKESQEGQRGEQQAILGVLIDAATRCR